MGNNPPDPRVARPVAFPPMTPPTPHRTFSRPCRGFTLLELLVVIAIIAVLAALAFPVFNKAREGSQSTQCMANLRQIFIGIQGYVQEKNGQYPPSATGQNGVNGYWFAAIGPYLDEGRRFDQSKVSTGPWPQKIPFACPAVEKGKHGWGGAGIDVGINGYQVGATTNPNASSTTELRLAKASALSTTLLVADAANATTGVGAWQIGWRIGSNGRFAPDAGNTIATRHNGRANVLYFDGHVGKVSVEQLQDPEFLEKLGGPRWDQ
jgi:prepilin-type N-terminal cleavage/methylation domain-containing protein/prepilin-type processing-associated H-X9-DG protein